jgi:hypothetical protein
LYNWLDTQESSSAEEPEGLDYLISEVGFVIAVRRSVVLRQALDIACWIFQKGYSRLCESIAKDCDHGLIALLQEATYERSEPLFDVPSIRAACARLALAMATRPSYSALLGVAGWLAAARDDPLPELRNAVLREAKEPST